MAGIVEDSKALRDYQRKVEQLKADLDWWAGLIARRPDPAQPRVMGGIGQYMSGDDLESLGSIDTPTPSSANLTEKI